MFTFTHTTVNVALNDEQIRFEFLYVLMPESIVVIVVTSDATVGCCECL